MNETRQIEHPVVEPVTTEYDNVQASVDEKNEQYDRRFQGTRTLYGTSAVNTFAASHVYIIGVGGVGSWRQKRWHVRQSV